MFKTSSRKIPEVASCMNHYKEDVQVLQNSRPLVTDLDMKVNELHEAGQVRKGRRENTQGKEIWWES